MKVHRHNATVIFHAFYNLSLAVIYLRKFFKLIRETQWLSIVITCKERGHSIRGFSCLLYWGSEGAFIPNQPLKLSHTHSSYPHPEADNCIYMQIAHIPTICKLWPSDTLVIRGPKSYAILVFVCLQQDTNQYCDVT